MNLSPPQLWSISWTFNMGRGKFFILNPDPWWRGCAKMFGPGISFLGVMAGHSFNSHVKISLNSRECHHHPEVSKSRNFCWEMPGKPGHPHLIIIIGPLTNPQWHFSSSFHLFVCMSFCSSKLAALELCLELVQRVCKEQPQSLQMTRYTLHISRCLNDSVVILISGYF